MPPHIVIEGVIGIFRRKVDERVARIDTRNSAADDVIKNVGCPIRIHPE